MSQFYVNSTGGGGGGLTPADVLASDTVDNDSEGIRAVISGDTVTIELTNRISVPSSTTGAVTESATIFTPVDDSGFTYRVLISGYDAINDETTGGELIGIGRKSAGAVTIIADNDVFSDGDTGLAATDWDILANGADVDIQFLGVAGRTIAWRALFEYIQTP